jgi:hypothetical protein
MPDWEWSSALKEPRNVISSATTTQNDNKKHDDKNTTDNRKKVLRNNLRPPEMNAPISAGILALSDRSL